MTGLDRGRRGGTPRHDLPVLEAYRAVAASMVLVTHVGYESGRSVTGPWAGWLSRLDFGVALFFLLSGLLLFRPFVEAGLGTRPDVEVGDYLRRRMLRIFPGLLVAMAITAALLPQARTAEPSAWLATGLLVQNYFTATVFPIAGLAQLWSLCVELSFYLVLPGLAWLAFGGRGGARRNRLPHLLVGMWAVALAWQLLAADGVRLPLWLPRFLDWFAAGMFLGWLLVRGDQAPRLLREAAQSTGACWGLGIALFWLSTPAQIAGPYGLEEAGVTSTVLKHQLYLFAAFFLVLPAVLGDRQARWRRTASSRPMLWLGTVSYGLFLLHATVLQLVRRALGLGLFDGGFWITLIPTLLISIGAAALLWYLVEKPVQRLRSMTVIEAIRASTVRSRIQEGVDLVDYPPLSRAVAAGGPRLTRAGSSIAALAAAGRRALAGSGRLPELPGPAPVQSLPAAPERSALGPAPVRPILGSAVVIGSLVSPSSDQSAAGNNQDSSATSGAPAGAAGGRRPAHRAERASASDRLFRAASWSIRAARAAVTRRAQPDPTVASTPVSSPPAESAPATAASAQQAVANQPRTIDLRRTSQNEPTSGTTAQTPPIPSTAASASRP